MNDPFTVLGLPARRDLSDEDVRAAWRRVAATTHPDLADGGDPGRYSAAAAAYDTLRTPFGRGEALADLGLARPPGRSRATRHGSRRRGVRPRRPPARSPRAVVPPATGRTVLAAGIVMTAAAAVAAVGWTPASIALAAGAATWLLTGWGRWRWGGRGR